MFPEAAAIGMQAPDALRCPANLRDDLDVNVPSITGDKLSAFLTFPHFVHLAIATIQLFASPRWTTSNDAAGWVGLDESNYRKGATVETLYQGASGHPAAAQSCALLREHI
jgi:hypothetical protein